MPTELAAIILTAFIGGAAAIYVLVKAIAALGNNIIRWSRAMEQHEEQRELWFQEKSALRDEIDRLEDVVTGLTDKLEESAKHQTASDTRITLLEQQLIGRDNRIMSLEADVKRLRDERETLAQEKALLSARVVSLECTVEELQAKLAATSTVNESIIVIEPINDPEDDPNGTARSDSD